MDIRDRQELLTEGRIAMDLARSAAPVVEDLEGLEETRKQLVREALKHEQEARDREVKSRQIAKADALAKETAEKELTAKKAKEALAIKKSRQAEEA